MVTLNVTQHKTNFKYVHLVRNVRFIESLSNEPIFEGNFGMMGVSLSATINDSKILKATKIHWFSGFSGAND